MNDRLFRFIKENAESHYGNSFLLESKVITLFTCFDKQKNNGN